MPKGGKRPGAGRPKGTFYPEKRNRMPILLADLKTRGEARQKLQENTPLDVMVKTMTAFVDAAQILGSKMVNVDDKIVRSLTLLKQAAEIAKDCAPYVHSKMPTKLEHGGPDGEGIKHHVTVELVKGAAPR